MTSRIFLSSSQRTIFQRKTQREISSWPFNRGGPAAFSSSSTAEQVTEGIDATGLTAIVTGGSSGIGAETVRVLALRGAQVIMAVRNVSTGNKLKESIVKNNSSARLDVLELELSSMASVKNFASQISSMNLRLNILINNAGVMATPFSLSPDGIELQFATNYIGHFLLTHLLLDKMKSTASSCNAEGRIVTVASSAHKFTYSEGIRFNKISEKLGYQTWRAYGQSKLSSILHTFELSRRLQEEGANVTVNSLHPGVVYTNLSRHSGISTVFQNTLGKLLMKNVQQGAATSCYLALHPEVKGVTGKYFCDCKECRPSSRATDADLAKKLWDFSMDTISPWI